jgi:predicted aspartyl protease
MPSGFGTVDVPFASLEVQDAKGEWLKFAFMVDSGAVITVMGLNHALELGIKLDQETLMVLAGVRGREDNYHIHTVNVKIGHMILNDIPIAFADGELFNPLLGRLDIFSRLGIFFSPKLKHTIFSVRN